MSEVILDWLNKEVGLSRKVKVFERDFSSGYLFGELLHKSGLIEDFEGSFRDDGGAAAKRNNFTQLLKALQGSAQGLGIHLKGEQVTEIMNEDRGSSLRLLYQIRKGLRKVTEPPPIRAAKKEEATRRFPDQEPFEPAAEFFQNTTLKTLKPGDPRVPFEINCKQFVDEHFRQNQVAANKLAREKQDLFQKQSNFRSDRREVYSNNHTIKVQNEREGVAKWQESVERNTRIAEVDLLFEQKTIARDRAKVEKIRQYYIKDTGYGQDEQLNGIGWFEQNLQRFGIDAEGDDEPMKPGYKEATGIKELQERLPTITQQKVESDNLNKRIQTTVKANEQARKERVRRNHREHLNRVREENEQAAHEQEELLLQRLIQESAEHRSRALAFEMEQRRKQAESEQRADKATTSRAKRERLGEEAAARMAERARAERAAAQAKKAAERDREEERRRLQAASGISPPPPQPEDDTSDEEDEEDDEGADGPTIEKQLSSVAKRSMSESFRPPLPVSDLMECMRDPAVIDFVFLRGTWSLHRASEADLHDMMASRGCSDAGTSPPRPQLGRVVRAVAAPEQSEPLPKQAVQLPQDLLPVVMLSGSPVLGVGSDGKPLTATLAQKMKEEFQVAVLDPRKVALESIELARAMAEEPEWPAQARLHQIGKRLLDMRRAPPAESEQPGPAVVSVPPDLTAELVFRKIELLSAPPPKPPEADPDPKAKKKPAKKDDKAAKDEEEDGVRPKGIVVLGFPADFAQYSALEVALRGYAAPLLRVLDGDADRRLRVSSVLAPWWKVQEERRSWKNFLELSGPPALPDAPGAVPVAPVIRICAPDPDALRSSVLAEAERLLIAESEPPAPPPKGGKGEPPPAEPQEKVFCQGSDEELARCTLPVDRAFLDQDAQALVAAFASPIGAQHTIFTPELPKPAEGEEETPEPPEPADEFCYSKVRQLVSAWYDASRPAEEAADPAASPQEEQAEAADGAEPSADAEEAVAAEGGEAEEAAEDAPEVAPADLKGPSPLGYTLQPEELAQLRKAWLSSMEDYFTATRVSMQHFNQMSSSFGGKLVQMQRYFLDELQQPDDKAKVLDEFLEHWPKTRSRLSQEQVLEELDELSDQLWQITDQRRATAVEERLKLMEGGFWESEAAACLRQTENQQKVEAARFRAAASLLVSAAGMEPLADNALGRAVVSGPEGLSSLQELQSWMRGSTESLAGGDLAAACGDGCEARVLEALRAEQASHAARLRALERRAGALLKDMFIRLSDVFGSMDDWIKDRVTAENEAIRAMMEQMGNISWEEAEYSGVSPKSTSHSWRSPNGRRSSADITMTPKRNAMLRKVRKDLHTAMQPRLLDVTILQPEVAAGSMHPNAGTSSVGSHTLDGWSFEMLRGLMRSLQEAAGSTGAVALETAFEALLQRRNLTFGFESELVPQTWALRGERALAAVCRSFVCPAWGAAQVDITEFVLTLTMHVRQMPWPSISSLEASRRAVEEGSTEEQRSAWPDVPVSEATFLRLPFLDEMLLGGSSHSRDSNQAMKKLIFQILFCFERESDPSPPGKIPQDATVTARRLFTYFCLGAAPTDGLQRSFRLLMPPPHLKGQDGEEEAAPRWRILDLWRLLFGCEGRPAGAAASPPELADFVKGMMRPALEGDAGDAGKKGAAKAKAKPKADPKAKGKPPSRGPTPGGDDETALVPPEEATSGLEEKALLSHPQVVKALCSHGALLCRKTRALAGLFPAAGGDGSSSVCTAAQAEALSGLEALPPPEPAAPAEEDPAA